MWLTAPHLSVPHGFSLRGERVQGQPFSGLNMDDRPQGSLSDDPQRVRANRERAVAALGFGLAQVALLEQVHGAAVVQAVPGTTQQADAQVTDRPGVLLAILTADCYPLLLHDPQAGVLGAAHAGWRGTLGRVGAATVQAMTALGADPARIQVAVGPGICASNYEVSSEIAGQFVAAGLGSAVQGRQLDLAAANRQVLLEAGVQPPQLWLSGRCSTEGDFYSFRRDHGVTGRMWAVIGRLPDERLADERLADERLADGQVAGGRGPEARP